MRAHAPGFTLVELLVGLLLMTLLAVMSWRGLDGMLRSQERLGEHSQALASLHTALGQWTTDLDQAAEGPYLDAIAWDGELLRIVRRSVSEDALVVVAWASVPSSGPGRLQWRRWQSAPVRDRAALLRVWREAPARLAEDAVGGASGEGAVNLTPLDGWLLLSPQGAGWAPAPRLGTQPSPGAEPAQVEPPAALRLQLQLPAASGLEGVLELDWLQPGQSRGRS